MPTPRKRRQVALSLFAFQDIITSVTAIMILLVLILTLELVTRTSSRGVAVEDQRVAAELRQQVAVLASRVEVLRTEQKIASVAARRAAGMSIADIERRQAEADRAVRLLVEENAGLAARARTAKVTQRAAEQELVESQSTEAAVLAEHAAAIQARAAEIENANQRERERQQEKQSEADVSSARSLVFNPDPGNTRVPVLVDVSIRGIEVIDGRRGGPRHYAWQASGPSPDFARWLTGLDATLQYVVVLLRPSAVEQFDAVRDAVTQAGLSIGLELIGESVSVVVPSAGGSP
jgi:hypothetical protein